MEKLIHIDDFSQECGYFAVDYEKSRGHVCTHPECLGIAEDIYGDYKQCFLNSCPLGRTAELDDMKRLDPEFADTLTIGEWLVIGIDDEEE